MIRNHDEICIAGTTFSHMATSTLQIETLAMYHGLCLALTKNLTPIIVETDSQVHH
ncbi:hypothetical protein P3S67_021768 [Capsicum chacoense]